MAKSFITKAPGGRNWQLIYPICNNLDLLPVTCNLHVNFTLLAVALVKRVEGSKFFNGTENKNVNNCWKTKFTFYLTTSDL